MLFSCLLSDIHLSSFFFLLLKHKQRWGSHCRQRRRRFQKGNLKIQSDAAKSWLLEYHRWIRLDSDLLGRRLESEDAVDLYFMYIIISPSSYSHPEA